MVGSPFSRFGQFASDWPLVRLREGLEHRAEWILLDDEKIYRRVTAKVRNQGVLLRDEVPANRIDTKRQQLCRSGQLLVAEIDAKVGGMGFIPDHLEGAIVSSHYFLFDVDSEVFDRAWLDQIVRAGRLQRQVDALGSTNYAAIRPRDVLAFQVPRPPLAEQKAIAGVLTAAERAVASQETLAADIAEAKRNVMRELHTLGVARDPVRLRPLCEKWVMGRVAEGVEAAPEGWRLVPLTRVARLESGHTPSRDRPDWWAGDIPWISLQDTERLQGLEIFDSAETIGADGLSNSSARLLPKGTVVFQRTASVGQCSIMGRPMATSQHFANWVCGPEIEPRYLLQVFRHMTREWERLQAGSVLPDIYMPTFKRLQILLPPRPEQLRIADVGEAFDRRLEAERAHLAELRATRDALAAELLSGRLRLPAAVIARHASADPRARAA